MIHKHYERVYVELLHSVRCVSFH